VQRVSNSIHMLRLLILHHLNRMGLQEYVKEVEDQ
jgi:hypothetical protein